MLSFLEISRPPIVHTPIFPQGFTYYDYWVTANSTTIDLGQALGHEIIVFRAGCSTNGTAPELVAIGNVTVQSGHHELLPKISCSPRCAPGQCKLNVLLEYNYQNINSTIPVEIIYPIPYMEEE